jgi:hypothetical protein
MIYKISPDPSLLKRGKEKEIFVKEGRKRGTLPKRGIEKVKTGL